MILNHHRLLKKQNHPHLPLNLIELFQSTQQIGAFQKRVLQSLSQVLFTSLRKQNFWNFWAIWVQQELENWDESLPEICLTPGLIPLQANRDEWNWREIIVIQAMALEAAHQLVETLPLEEDSLNMLLGIQDALVEDSSDLDPKGFEMARLGLPILPVHNLDVSIVSGAGDSGIQRLPAIKISISPLSPEHPSVGKIISSWLWEMANQYGLEMSYLGLIFIADFNQTEPPWQQSKQYLGSELRSRAIQTKGLIDSDLKQLYRRLELIKQSSTILEEKKLEQASLERKTDKLWDIENLTVQHSLGIEGIHGRAKYSYEVGNIEEIAFSISPGQWCQKLIELFGEDCLSALKKLGRFAEKILNINIESQKLALKVALFLLDQYWQGHESTWQIGEILNETESIEKIQSMATNSMRRHSFFKEWNSTLKLFQQLGWDVADNPLLKWEDSPLSDMGWLEETVAITLSSDKPIAMLPALITSETAVSPEQETLDNTELPTVRKMDKISSKDLEKALSSRGMSQAKLARSLNLDRSTINRWINGSRPIHPRYRPALWELLGEALNP